MSGNDRRPSSGTAVRPGNAELARAALYSGFIGGIGFAAASMLKLVEVTSGYETNWHSILEQTTGLFNGIGIAVAIAVMARRTGVHAERPTIAHWTEPWRWASSLLAIPYLNSRKNVAQWVATEVDARTDGRRAHLGLVRSGIRRPRLLHVSRRSVFVTSTSTAASRAGELEAAKGNSSISSCSGRSYVFNFERAVVAFTAQRLVTEGVLYLVALACTLVLLLGTERDLVSFHERNRCTRGAATIRASNNGGRGHGRGGPFDRGRLGHRAGNPRRPPRQSCPVAHSFRAKIDDHFARSSLINRTSCTRLVDRIRVSGRGGKVMLDTWLPTGP